MNIKTYISSGIIESFVAGLATSEEIAELEAMRQEYPDLDIAIRECEYDMENYIQLQRDHLPPEKLRQRVKQMLMVSLEAEKNKTPYINNSTSYPDIKLSPDKMRVHIGWKTLLIYLLIYIAVSLVAAAVFFFMTLPK